MRFAALGVAILALGVAIAAGAVALTRSGDDGGGEQGQQVGSKADVGLEEGEVGVAPSMPVTPSVETMTGELEGNTRTFRLTAAEFEQKIANFPIETATVWGYNGSTPGPTLVIREGEEIRVEITNDLPPTDPRGDMPPGPQPTSTTIHFHGTHMPNEDDGVAGISQPQPIGPGQVFIYQFTPEHAGSFAYHSHTDGAVQELRGLDGMLIVQPAGVERSERVDRDLRDDRAAVRPRGQRDESRARGRCLGAAVPAGHRRLSHLDHQRENRRGRRRGHDHPRGRAGAHAPL